MIDDTITNQMITLDGLKDFAKRIPTLGNSNNTAGNNAMAIGDHITVGNNALGIGTYNSPVAGALLIIGNGDQDTPSNALTITKDKIDASTMSLVTDSIQTNKVQTIGERNNINLLPYDNTKNYITLNGNIEKKNKALRIDIPSAGDTEERCTGTFLRLGHISLFGMHAGLVDDSDLLFNRYKDLRDEEFHEITIQLPGVTIGGYQDYSDTIPYSQYIYRGIWDVWVKNGNQWELMLRSILILPPYSQNKKFYHRYQEGEWLHYTKTFKQSSVEGTLTVETSSYDANGGIGLSFSVKREISNLGSLNVNVPASNLLLKLVPRIAFP